MVRKALVFIALGILLFFSALFISFLLSGLPKQNVKQEISTNETNITSHRELDPPEKILTQYYKLISEKKWSEAFALRSNRTSSTLEEFKKTWSSNDSVSIENLSIEKQTDSDAIVKATLISNEIDGTTGVYKATINLSFEDGTWKYNGGNFDKTDSSSHLEAVTQNKDDNNSTPKEPISSPEATQAEPMASQDIQQEKITDYIAIDIDSTISNDNENHRNPNDNYSLISKVTLTAKKQVKQIFMYSLELQNKDNTIRCFLENSTHGASVFYNLQPGDSVTELSWGEFANIAVYFSPHSYRFKQAEFVKKLKQGDIDIVYATILSIPTEKGVIRDRIICPFQCL
ncbi:MAG: hypothetical protein AB2L18_12680 [Anaerolineaceae bacterium]